MAGHHILFWSPSLHSSQVLGLRPQYQHPPPGSSPFTRPATSPSVPSQLHHACSHQHSNPLTTSPCRRPPRLSSSIPRSQKATPLPGGWGQGRCASYLGNTWGARLHLPVHPPASPPVPGLTAFQVNPCLPPGLRDATWPCAYHPDHCSQAATATSVLSTSSALSPSSRQGLQAAPGNLHLDKRDRCQMERAALLRASQAPGTWAQASCPPAASQLLGLRDQVSGSQC